MVGKLAFPMAGELRRKEVLDYSAIPLVALKHSTRTALSQCLNGPKVIPSPSNLPRDWRGLAHIAGVISPHVGCPDPTAAILVGWEKVNPSIQLLLDALKELDRWDVIDDTAELIEKDVLDYKLTIENGRYRLQNEEPADSEILTVDDVQCIESCGLPQYYDAFLLFDDSDKEFAFTMLYKLENEYGMKLCTKDRDLIGGLPFEHVAIMQLIRDRCRRLIVIVSPAFLESPANKFFVSFAQAVGVEQQQRKIIPCVYLKFPRPAQLSFYFVLDFTRTSQLWDHWERLSQSLRAASPRPSISSSQPRAILPANRPVPNQALNQTSVTYGEAQAINQTSGIGEYKALSTDHWDYPKKAQVVINEQTADSPSCAEVGTASQPIISTPPQSELSESPDCSKVDSPLSTGESLSGHSESEPILRHSTSSSTASLLSKVFTQRRFTKPKSWFKRKKKTPVAVNS